MHQGMGDGYYTFSGQDLVRTKRVFQEVKNDFTCEFWVNPEAEHEIDPEQSTGASGISGKRYVIGPGFGLTADSAGAGISVGTNGISVYEHSTNYLPAVLVYQGTIAGWNHIAIVYRNRTPYLYINGKFAKRGQTCPLPNVHASGTFGGLDPYGCFFIGGLDNVKIWRRALTEEEIERSMQVPSANADADLFGCWTFDDGNGIVESNLVHPGISALVAGAEWTPGRLFRHGRIGIVIASSAYDATRHFAFDLTKAFMELNYRAEVIDLLLPGGPSKLERLLLQPDLRLMIGMNGHGIDNLRDRLYQHRLPVPFLSYFVDHPMFHVSRFPFDRHLPQLIVSCVDREHHRYLETFFRNSSVKLFVPQAAMNALPVRRIKPMTERGIALLFAGTNLDPDGYRNQWYRDPLYGEILDEIAERTVYQHEQSLVDIAEHAFQERGRPFFYPKDDRLVELLPSVDLYVRGRRRLEILQSLSDLPLTIVTDAPLKLASGSRVQYREPVDIKSLQAMMYDSKIVLNVLANLVYGGHERIFTAMRAGAVSLTDRNPYLSDHFNDGNDILLFSFRDPALPDRVGRLLNRPDVLQNIANEALKAVPQHTWRARAASILRGLGLPSGG